MRTDLSDYARTVLAKLIARLGDGPICGAEIGVAAGATSAWLLESFEELHLTMVDAWQEWPEGHPYRESGDRCASLDANGHCRNWLTALAETEFAADRRRVLRGDSVEMAREIEPYSCDFVLIDGDHTCSGVRRDLAAWENRVRRNGLLCGHDIDHPRDLKGIWGVRRAVEEYAQTVSGKLVVDSRATLWWFEPFG